MENLLKYPWLQPYFDEINNHHRHHALLLTGDNGVGKEALATALAFRWLGEDNALNQQSLVAGSHPDLHVLVPEKTTPSYEGALRPYAERFWGKNLTVISTEMVRDLSEKLLQSPMMGNTKVAIILEAERMSQAAANTILKILEEPPSDTRFILTTDHVDYLSATVKSRCINYPINGALTNESNTNDWRVLALNAPLMHDYMVDNEYDKTYELIEKVMPVALSKPASISEAAFLLSERSKNGLWDCLFAWIYQYQRTCDIDSDKSRKVSDFYREFLKLSNDAQKAALDVRTQLYALISRHSPL